MKGTIRARGKGRWQVQVYAGRDTTGRERRVARTIHGTRADADNALRDLIRQVQAGQHRADSPTVTELAEQWYQARQRSWSPRVRTEYRRHIDRKIVPRLGDRKAAQLTARDIDLAYAALAADGTTDHTIDKTHTVLRSMYAQAVRWGIVAANPAGHATPPRIADRPVEVPNPAKVGRLIAALDDDPRLAAFVRTAATTGCRRSEMCALQWADLDLDEGRLTVSRALDGHGGIKLTKTERAKTMALDPATVAALARWRAALNQLHLAAKAGPPLWVFPSDRDLDRPVRADVMSHAWARLRDRHDLEGVKLNHLRHFMASQMLAAGVDVRTVASRLGHANPSTTLRVYAHLIPEADRAAADQLAAIIDNTR